eukprot:COSAG05_NODE_4630_length_1432_cov_6.337584_2_plen_166_part_00
MKMYRYGPSESHTEDNIITTTTTTTTTTTRLTEITLALYNWNTRGIIHENGITHKRLRPALSTLICCAVLLAHAPVLCGAQAPAWFGELSPTARLLIAPALLQSHPEDMNVAATAAAAAVVLGQQHPQLLQRQDEPRSTDAAAVPAPFIRKCPCCSESGGVCLWD